jgi:hypothetical protein
VNASRADRSARACAIRSRELGYDAAVKSHAPVALRSSRRWILVAAIGLTPATAFAQAPAGEATPGEADGQPATTDATSAPASDAAPSDAPPSVNTPTNVTPEEPRFTFEPFGYLRLQYKAVRNDPFVEFVGRDDGFELQNARLGVRGRLAQRATYVLSIDGAVDERAQVNVPDGKLRVGLRDAYADVRMSGTVAVRGGYFETLVDPDLDDDTQREFVDRPLVSRGVRATQGYQTPGLPPGRSLGAALRLDPTAGTGERVESGVKVGFELAVQNGADEFASDNDNDLPAISLSAFARMPNRTWLVASGRWNRRTDGELPLQRDEDDFQGSAGARIAAGPVAFGVGGVVQRTQFPTTGGPVRNSYGAHASFVFTVPGSLPIGLGYRFGILDPSSLILTDRVMEHTAGAVLAVPSLRLRVQLQLTLAMEQGDRDLANDRAQICAELSL